MKKELATKTASNSPTTEISKRYTDDDVKKLVRDHMHIEDDPEHIFHDAAGALEKYNNGNKQEKRRAVKLIKKHSQQLVAAQGLENHYHIAEAVNERYRPLILNVVRQIEKDYQCATALEKATAELAALSYVRAITDEKRLNIFFGTTRELSHEVVGNISVLSKQADRSYRHYISTIIALKQLKQPHLEVNIRAKNAFVARNQQINANKDSYENIQPK